AIITALTAGGVVWAKDRAHSFLTRQAALSSVYNRHTPGLRTSIGGLFCGCVWLGGGSSCSSRWTSGGKSEGRGCRCPIGACMRVSGACNEGVAFWLTATPAADKRDALITLIQTARRHSLWGAAPALPPL